MTKNIKEIGKELLGKSLNSFHRKTGLTQLEKNNEMQDGILNGILSQVDNAYIEKTEQSNVIHLDGSSDGVVVVDGIEGNTMVNLWKGVASLATNWIQGDLTQEITSKILTVCNLTDKRIFFELSTIDGSNSGYSRGIHVESNSKLKIIVTSNEKKRMVQGRFSDGWLETEIDKFKKGVLVIEGDCTNKEIPHYFEGLQSSFEEQVEEDKYKIEILSQNKNLFNKDDVHFKTNSIGVLNKDGSFTLNSTSDFQNGGEVFIRVKKGETYTLSYAKNVSCNARIEIRYYDDTYTNQVVSQTDLCTNSLTFFALSNVLKLTLSNGTYVGKVIFSEIQLEKGVRSSYISHKQNKIKLLINEPLRAIDTIKDKLCVKDNRLVIERNCGEVIFNGSEDWRVNHKMTNNTAFWTKSIPNVSNIKIPISDKFKQLSHHLIDEQGTFTGTEGTLYLTHSSSSIEELKVWLQSNLTTMVFPLAEPYYEEVLNEYGEPIILEGYENGTLYIDSTIVPTTTVRYTPKMESFKTVKEVNNNNVMLTSDINDAIIPYMLEVDMMILEKEMAIMSHKNIRKIGEKDMTSMQKRTQQMLERLIKGRTLTEQECQTRVTTYLNANKITDEQAEELMLLISEVYA